ncbi:MAG: PASTA domain-containing protein [Bacteroidales bacterium]|nr:PASTA domain-containing protein [Bacteroidales bacterium]MBR3712997.1 PASTA domain-containing protein [Bacteroidales bacterium]MBR4272869.1 PASTA domain-containing protein [Bacteroidales bacterium]
MVDKVKNGIVKKAGFMYGAVLILMVIVLVRVFQLKMVGEKEWEDKSASIKTEEEEGVRGDIISSDGRLLATSVPSYDLIWDFRVNSLRRNNLFENNVDTLSLCMSRLFGDSSAQAYAKMFRKAFEQKKSYFVFKSKISFNQMQEVRKFPIFQLGRYKSGLIIQEQRTRKYPHNELARRCIGYVNDGVQVGMEQAFNADLAGTKGKIRKYKVAGGDLYPLGTVDNDNMPQDGNDVIVTLDVGIQDVAERSLMKYLDTSRAQWGVAIVMEVATGKIRAMANLQYDPKSGKYIESFNHAIGSKVPPGSTFKLPTMIAVLEKTGMDIDEKIDMPGKYYKLPGKETKAIEDEKPHIFTGPTPIRTLFELSSNVGLATLARMAYPTSEDEKEFTARLGKMNLGSTTGIDIDGEIAPILRDAGSKYWWGGALEKMAIGYETEFSPLQILTLYNAVANGGKMMRPYLKEAVRKHGVITEVTEPVTLHWSICDEATLKKVVELLVGVVDNGTANRIKNKYFKIAGKTGTAQIFEGDRCVGHSASFAGFFPADKPKYSGIVVVYKPQNGQFMYGSAVAAPVFGEIVDALCANDRDLHTKKDFDLASNPDKNQLPDAKGGDKAVLDRLFSDFNVQVGNVEQSQQYHFVSTEKEGDVVNLQPVPQQKVTVPNVVGMGLRDAMYLLRKLKLKVTAVGRGTVKKQSLPPYTKIKSGDKITIELAIN